MECVILYRFITNRPPISLHKPEQLITFLCLYEHGCCLGRQTNHISFPMLALPFLLLLLSLSLSCLPYLPPLFPSAVRFLFFLSRFLSLFPFPVSSVWFGLVWFHRCGHASVHVFACSYNIPIILVLLCSTFRGVSPSTNPGRSFSGRSAW